MDQPSKGVNEAGAAADQSEGSMGPRHRGGHPDKLKLFKKTTHGEPVQVDVDVGTVTGTKVYPHGSVTTAPGTSRMPGSWLASTKARENSVP